LSRFELSFQVLLVEEEEEEEEEDAKRWRKTTLDDGSWKPRSLRR
jgi:hypothetical protein